MSIPPLVCSTPPPPDQCEEDKDPEDFDIHYNLSQEEDDDENVDYVYGNFSNFNHFEIQPSIKDNTPINIALNQSTEMKNVVLSSDQSPEPLSEIKDLEVGDTVEVRHSDNIKNDIISENSSKSDEENYIEDLDLKLEQCTSSNLPIVESDVNKYDLDMPAKDKSVTILNVDGDLDDQNLDISPHKLETRSNYSDENECVQDDTLEFIPDSTVIDRNDTYPQSEVLDTEVNKSIKVPEALPDDDFDEFLFTNPEVKSNVIMDTCDNPWEENVDENDEFGSFSANFDQMASNSVDTTTTEVLSDNMVNKFEEQLKNRVSIVNAEDDDDFGDFDDFKSSNIAAVARINTSCEFNTDIYQQVPVLNLELSDKGHQILDSVNQVLNSIFIDDIVTPDTEFECKLESLLSETWRHLIETDIRQPYIVNWNNSLGQKTLLRALCIDSRNILFGPKWSHNMPKYAVTMSTAPLQPQKPVLLTSTSQDDTTTSLEKATNKASNWTHPFSSDGQESCNTESEVASLEKKSEVFDSSEPTKSGSLYPSNVTVQPIRQISLPDTHIFTPTDSETPRSNTIHYDTGPTVLLPGQHSDNPLAFHSEKSISKPDQKTETHIEDSDYWEFQDFKCTPKISTTETSAYSNTTVAPAVTSSSTDTQKLNNTYQGELLQPIKMNPVIPRLNWPNPGEVKEVFDDFTDFVSNSTWSKERKDVQISDNEPIAECDEPKTANNQTNITQPNFQDSIDDDFDTFQYALPTQKTNNIPDNINISNISNIQPSKILPVNQNIEEVISKLNFNVSDTKSSATQSRQGVPFSKHMLSMSNVTDISSGKPALSYHNQSQSILQPIPTSSNTHQNAGQILQPLSLESYSQLNWPSPGIDLQDLSKFNPVETLHSLKSDLSTNNTNKTSSPIHNQKSSGNNQATDDELWGEFVSSNPKPHPPAQKKTTHFGDDDEWTDFVSSPSVRPQNGLNTISFNVHTNSNMQKNTYHSKMAKSNQSSLDIPTLNYITPKTNNKPCNDRHFQNL